MLARLDRALARFGFLARWAPAALCYGLIFTLTALPGTDGESTRSALAAFGLGDWNTVLRSAAHVGVFGLEAVLVWGALHRGLDPDRPGATRSRRWAALVALALAASDELHQGFVPGRHARWIDFGYDAIGVFAGLWALPWVWHRTVRSEYK